MQGKRAFFVPPGGYLSCLLMPLLAIGSMALGFMLSAVFYPLQAQSASTDLAPLLVPIGLAIVLMGVGFVLLLRLVFSSVIWVQRLSLYVACLLAAAVISFLLAAAGVINVPTGISLTGIVALSCCLLIARSSALVTLSTFFSLKRDYRKKLQG